MVKTLSMQDLRYLNLFEKITKVKTRHCFNYNEMIVFAIPKKLISKALGKNAENLRKISQIVKRKIRIVALPTGIEDAKGFFLKIVDPVAFKELEVKDDEIVITAGSSSKAALIGRNKRRLLELQKIAEGFFNKGLRVA